MARWCKRCGEKDLDELGASTQRRYCYEPCTPLMAFRERKREEQKKLVEILRVNARTRAQALLPSEPQTLIIVLLVEPDPLPPPTPDEYDALLLSIELHGQILPVIVTRDGYVIDGIARLRACSELGVSPRIRSTDKGDTADERRELRIGINSHRRHLTPPQVRRVVEAELFRTPTSPDRTIAALTGVSHPIAAKVRTHLIERGRRARLA